MSAITDLPTLLKTMSPKLANETYVIVTTANESILLNTRAVGKFVEDEGTTVICELREAERLGYNFESRFRKITLEVNSSLHAVGFLANISKALSDHNLSCNVVSAYFHDHLFIHENDAERAIKILTDLSKSYADNF